MHILAQNLHGATRARGVKPTQAKGSAAVGGGGHGKAGVATVMAKFLVLATFGLLGPVLAHLGTVLGHLGPVLGHLGPVFAHLGPVLAHLGPVLAHLGLVLAHLGPVLGLLGPVLGHLGAAFGHPSCNTKAQSEKPKGVAGVASASRSGRAPVPIGTGR